MTRIHLQLGACLLGLVAGLALAPAARADEKYYPADTELIVTLNIRQILESDLAQGKKEALAFAKAALEQALQRDEEAAKYWKDLSFDLFRDLDNAAIVMAASPDPTKVLVILNGRIDAKKFIATAERAAQDHGDILKVTKSGSNKILEITTPGQEQTLHLALVGSKVLLASPGKATLTTALAQGEGDKAAELKKEVKDLLATRDKKASLSFVATGNALVKLGELLGGLPQVGAQAQQAQQMLKQVAGVSASITVGNDIQFQLGVGTSDAATAKQSVNQANLMLGIATGMVAMKAKEDQRLAPLVDVVKSLRCSSEGSTILFRGRVPAAVIEAALKELKNQQP